MSSNLLLFSPKLKALDIKGNPISGAKLYTYTAGTSNVAVSYKDIDLTIAHSNPIISNNFGDFPAIYLGKTSYKIVLCDENDNVLWTLDNIDLYDENAYLVTKNSDGDIIIENTNLNKDIIFKATNTDYPNGEEVARISSTNMTIRYNDKLNVEEEISDDDDVPNVLWTKNKVSEASPYDFQSGFDLSVNEDLVNIIISPGNGTVENASVGNFLTKLTITKDCSTAWNPETQASVCCPISGPYDVSENPYYVSFTETSEVVEGETIYHTAATIRASTKFSFANGLEDTNYASVIYTLESDYSPTALQDIADGYYNLWVTYNSDTSTFTGYISNKDPIYLANVPTTFIDDTFYYISSINKTFIGSTETKAMYLGWFTIENGKKVRSRFTDYGEREDICTKLITKRAYTTVGSNSYTAPTNFKYATVIAIGGGGYGYIIEIGTTSQYYISPGGGGGAICRDILYDISSETFTVGTVNSASTFADMTASGGSNGAVAYGGDGGIGGIPYNTRSFTDNYVGVNGLDGVDGVITYSYSQTAGGGGNADYATLAATVGSNELDGYGTGLGAGNVGNGIFRNSSATLYGGGGCGYWKNTTQSISRPGTTSPYARQGLVLIIEVA